MDISIINEERKRQGLSIEELANLANLPKSTVEKIIFGIVKHPRIDTLDALEKALGINEKTPSAEDVPEDVKELFNLIMQMTEEEIQELSNFVDYVLSKRS